MYGKYICNSFADLIHDIIKPSHNYDAIPKQISEQEEQKEEEQEQKEEEEEEEQEQEEEQEEEEQEQEEQEQEEQKEEEEEHYTDLSLSWQCSQCEFFNHKYTAICRGCRIHKEVREVLEEIILKIYEKNIGLYEQSMNLSHSPNTTTINRMAAVYKTETNVEEASMSLDLNEWACIEKDNCELAPYGQIISNKLV